MFVRDFRYLENLVQTLRTLKLLSKYSLLLLLEKLGIAKEGSAMEFYETHRLA